MKRFLTALLVVTLLISACAPTALASFKAKVFTNTRVYSAPSTSAKSLKVPKGLTVTVTATSGSWARVSYKGHTAYMPIPYLNLVNRMTAYTARSTPVYKQPSSSSGRLGTLPIGTAVYVVNKVNGYYRIQNKSGSVTGYVKGSYLTSKAKLTAAYNAYKRAQAAKHASTTPKRTPVSPSAGIVAFAKSFCGMPYSSSAKFSNNPSSFNCSSFVWFIMKQYGISVKDTASGQATDSRYTRISSFGSMKTGDIVCIDGDNDGSCDHTGIYIGSGKMVDASQSAKRVQVTSLGDWYKDHFMWAVRVK